MDKQAIYNALNPDWWTISLPNEWRTEYMNATILFNTEGITGCTYVSSAPYQTLGLNAGTSPFEGYEEEFRDALRTEAAQRLFDMHCKQLVGVYIPQLVTHYFGAQA
jgi:hypothetical protein